MIGRTRAARVRAGAAGCVALLAALLLAPAAAAPAPLRSAALHAQAFAAGPVTEPFAASPGTSLATMTNSCGDRWTVIGGTFTISAGQTAVSSTSALVTGTVPLCNSSSVNEEAGGDIHSSGSSTFGMLVNAAPGGRPSTAAVYSNSGAGTVQLQRIAANGTLTTWATKAGTGGGNTPRFLRVVYLNGVYTVSVNNVDALTYTLPDPATRTQVEAYNHVGIVSISDTRSSFDNFQAYPR